MQYKFSVLVFNFQDCFFSSGSFVFPYTFQDQSMNFSCMYLFCFLMFCVCLFVISVPQGQLHNFLLSVFFKNIFLLLFFIFGCAGSLLLCMGFLQLRQAGATYSVVEVDGLLIAWLLLLRSMGFRAHCLSSCGTWTQLPWAMWNLPGPGIRSVSPALAGGCSTTGPPGISLFSVFLVLWQAHRDCPSQA